MGFVQPLSEGDVCAQAVKIEELKCLLRGYYCSLLQEIREISECLLPFPQALRILLGVGAGGGEQTHEISRGQYERAYNLSPNCRFHTKYSPSSQKGDAGDFCIIHLCIFNHSVISSPVFAFQSLILFVEYINCPLQGWGDVAGEGQFLQIILYHSC